MIDSHCHLDQDPLYKNIDNVILRSKNEGINKILTICTTLKSFENILKLVNLDPIIFGTFGIHPHETEKNYVDQKTIENKVNEHKKIIGVGETGLDFYYNHSDKNKQIDSFKVHIESSLNLDIPLIIHSRSAENETFNILNTYKKHNPKILMHCFTGSKEFAKKLLDLNAFFSASGIITFKNSVELQKTFEFIPTDKILIETDAPFLAPIPFRGKTNEPSFIIHTLEKISKIKNIPKDKMIQITTDNFEKIFSINANK